MRLCAFLCDHQSDFSPDRSSFRSRKLLFSPRLSFKGEFMPRCKITNFFPRPDGGAEKRFFSGLSLKAWKVFKKALDVAFNCHVTCVERIVIEVIFAT